MTGLIAVNSVAYSVLERELYATVTVVRSGDLSGRAIVDYATASGTAVAGADFVQTAGTLDFGTRVARITVSIPILDDRLSEPTEKFSFSLISADSTSSLDTVNASTISILDDEMPLVEPGPDPLIPAYQVSATAMAPGFRYPISMVFLGDGQKVLVAEKSGIIRFADLADTTNKTSAVLDWRMHVNDSNDRGLLDIALYPDLVNHPYLYAFYVVDPPDAETASGLARRDQAGNRFSHLTRFTLDLSGSVPKVIEGSAVVLVGAAGKTLADISGGGELHFRDEDMIAETPSNREADGRYKRNYVKMDSQTHAGGAIAFGPDGMLYVSTGDGSAFTFADPRAANVQDIDSLNGKIFRLDPLTGSGLPDNPYFDGDPESNRSKVWALGLRNPYTMAFAPDGRLFLSDTGWEAWEEVNVVTGPGANFGWPFYEGAGRARDYESMAAAQDFQQRIEAGETIVSAPYVAFGHSDTDPGYRISCIVGSSSIYQGEKYPAPFDGAYFVTDFYGGEIYAIDTKEQTKVTYITDLGETGPSNFVQGPDGYIYLVDLGTGRILRLEISDPS